MRCRARECVTTAPMLARSALPSLASRFLATGSVQRGAQPLRECDGVLVRPEVHKEEARALVQQVTVQRDGCWSHVSGSLTVLNRVPLRSLTATMAFPFLSDGMALTAM